MPLLRRNNRGTPITIHVPGIVTMPALIIVSVPGASELGLEPERDIAARFLHRQAALILAGGRRPWQIAGTLLAYEDERGGLREDRMQLLHDDVGAPPRPPRSGDDLAAERAAVPLSLLDEELAEDLSGEESHLNYLLDDTPGTKRRGVRVPLIRPAAIIPEQLTQGWLNGATRNVSISGLLLAGAERLRAGERLRVRFELDHEDDVIDVVGKVVRDDDPWGLRGVRIARAGAHERERLIRFIYESQRRELARRTRSLAG